ncbi:MAG: hypothetical protein ACM359_18295 [Bacillota bacterium]
MKDYIDLMGIEVVAEGTGKHAFLGVFDSPRGQLWLPLPPETLLDYSACQHHVLVGTGWLYRYFLAEGMDEESADRVWRNLTETLLANHWRQVTNAASAAMN